jgi:hypothetical protein
MQASLALFSLFVAVAGSAPTRAAQPPNPNPDPAQPMPISSTRRDPEPYLLLGAYHAIGLNHGNGSATEFCWISRRGAVGVSHHRTIFETEGHRLSVVVGAQTGIDSEWYLGHGFSARVQFGIPHFPLGGLPLGFRLTFFWYPYEGIVIPIE